MEEVKNGVRVKWKDFSPSVGNATGDGSTFVTAKAPRSVKHSTVSFYMLYVTIKMCIPILH